MDFFKLLFKLILTYFHRKDDTIASHFNCITFLCIFSFLNAKSNICIPGDLDIVIGWFVSEKSEQRTERLKPGQKKHAWRDKPRSQVSSVKHMHLLDECFDETSPGCSRSCFPLRRINCTFDRRGRKGRRRGDDLAAGSFARTWTWHGLACTILRSWDKGTCKGIISIPLLVHLYLCCCFYVLCVSLCTHRITAKEGKVKPGNVALLTLIWFFFMLYF